MDKMAFRPGTVTDGVYILDYDFRLLTILIRECNLRFDDWIITHKSIEYIRGNWIAMFAKSGTSRRPMQNSDMTFQEAMEHHKKTELEKLLHKHSGVLYRVEKYEGIKRVVLYRALGKQRISEIRNQYDQTQRYGYCDHQL